MNATTPLTFGWPDHRTAITGSDLALPSIEQAEIQITELRKNNIEAAKKKLQKVAFAPKDKRRLAKKDQPNWDRMLLASGHECLDGLLDDLFNADGSVKNALGLEFAASCFAKETTRQNVFERYFLNSLSAALADVTTIQPYQLPKKGQPGAMYIGLGDPEKSLDFYWQGVVDGRTVAVVASHKYTRTDGGAQAHQYGEIERIVVGVEGNPKLLETLKGKLGVDEVLVLGIVDGPFYQTHSKGKSWLSKMQQKCASIPGCPVRVVSSAEAILLWRALTGSTVKQ